MYRTQEELAHSVVSCGKRFPQVHTVRELALMRKHLKTPVRITSERRRTTLHTLAQQGLVSISLDEDSETGELYETAKSTSLGKRLYGRDMTLRHPVKRFFYRIKSVLS